jgi:hypothetical protein
LDWASIGEPVSELRHSLLAPPTPLRRGSLLTTPRRTILAAGAITLLRADDVIE